MISVEVIRDQVERIDSIVLKGHAESGPYGHDLVCAAVSAVSVGSINAVEALCQTQLPVETGGEGGFLRCVVPNLEKNTDEKVQLLLEGMLESLKTIERDYGKYISIKQITRR